MIIKIVLLFLLILVNGVFSATEMAFLSINKYELSKEIRKKNKKAVKIAELLKDSSTFLSAIQIAITLSGFLASAFAAENFASELSLMISASFLSKETLTTILVVVITMILSYFTLVLGELVPKKIGLAYSWRISFGMVNVIEFVIIVCKPFIVILRSSTNLLIKFLKIEKKKENLEDEIKNSITDSNLEELEKKILLNVFEFNDTIIERVMTPKKDVIVIDVHSSKEEIWNVIKQYKYTRFPVMNGEQIVGVLNVKDLVIKHHEVFDLGDYIRKIVVLRHDMIIDDAYLYLNSNYEVIAKVEKDGKYIGIITLEDIIEEIVGNVFDEYDRSKGA